MNEYFLDLELNKIKNGNYTNSGIKKRSISQTEEISKEKLREAAQKISDENYMIVRKFFANALASIGYKKQKPHFAITDQDTKIKLTYKASPNKNITECPIILFPSMENSTIETQGTLNEKQVLISNETDGLNKHILEITGPYSIWKEDLIKDGKELIKAYYSGYVHKCLETGSTIDLFTIIKKQNLENDPTLLKRMTERAHHDPLFASAYSAAYARPKKEF